MGPVAATAAAAVAALVISVGALWFHARTAAAAAESARIARATRDRDDAPTFGLAPGQPRNFALPVTITVLSGPPSINLTVVFHTESTAAPQVQGQATLLVSGDSQQGEVSSQSALINGDDFVVNADCVYDHASVDVQVWLLSSDAADPTRQWHRKMRVSWPPPA